MRMAEEVIAPGRRRRRRARLGLALGLLMAVGAPPVQAAEPVVTAEGQVTAPLRFPLDATYSSWAGGQRNAYTIAGSNGHVGYTFELPEEVGGGAFALTVTGGATGAEDLDVTFYSSFNPVVSDGANTTRAAGGETGTIPGGSKYAIVTMFEGADARFKFEGWKPKAIGADQGGLPPLEPPSKPGIYPEFGHGGERFETWKKRLQSRSHVVIAVVDTGINPYHAAYRRPEYAVHPSHYIDGFPTDAPALGLTANGANYVAARGADDPDVWSKVEEKKLYWIPGTNIIGAYSVRDYEGTPPGGLSSRPVIDDDGHGTGTTSVAAGAARSSRDAPFGSNPEALIVSLEGLGDEGVKWASEQPWIDFISGSYGDPLAVPCDGQEIDDGGVWCGEEYRYTAPFVLDTGRTACFSAGNGASRTGVATDRYSSLRPTSGPSWVVTVGAVSPRNRQDYGWHSVPVDVSSFGLHWPAAAPFSLDGEQDFGGTSNATPVTCGVFSKALLEARRTLGDTVEGVHAVSETEKVPALGLPFKRHNGTSPLGDGILTRPELQAAVFKTALPTEFDARKWTHDPIVVPHTPLYYTQEGYGIADVDSAARAVDVLLGRAPMPDRSDVDAWIETVDRGRDAIYAPDDYRNGG